MKAALMGSALAFALWGGAALANNDEVKVRTDEDTVHVDVQKNDDDSTTDTSVGGSGQDESLNTSGSTNQNQDALQTEPAPQPAAQQTVVIEDQDDAMASKDLEEKKDENDARGVTVLLGGGVEGYTGDLAPRINAGPGWGVGVAFKPTDLLGLELGYTGAVNSVETGGNDDVRSNADIVRNGGQAVATVGLGAAEFQPYLLGGIGVDRYNVRDADGEGFRDDTVGNVPVGLGFRTHVGDFTADLRGQYGILFEQGFAPDEGRTHVTDVADGNTPTGRYGAQLRLGATF